MFCQSPRVEDLDIFGHLTQIIFAVGQKKLSWDNFFNLFLVVFLKRVPKLITQTQYFNGKYVKGCTSWPKYWLQNKTGVRDYDCGRGLSQLIHKSFKWPLKKEKKRKRKADVLLLDVCPVSATSLACFLCVNSSPHRLCLGYTPLWGACH